MGIWSIVGPKQIALNCLTTKPQWRSFSTYTTKRSTAIEVRPTILWRIASTTTTATTTTQLTLHTIRIE